MFALVCVEMVCLKFSSNVGILEWFLDGIMDSHEVCQARIEKTGSGFKLA